MRFIYVLLIALVATGCDSFLDVKPKGKAIPESIEDMSLLMNSGRISLSNHIYSDPDVRLGDSDFKILESNRDKKAYVWAEKLYEPGEKDGDWVSLYKAVDIANIVLGQIDNASGIEENLRLDTKGRAFALRAAAYFWLVNCYAKHYDAAQNDVNMAVPKVIKSDISQVQKRVSVGEIYDQVESDIDSALIFTQKINHSATEAALRFTPSKSGIIGFSAKVELFKGNFTAALDLANEALEMTNAKYENYYEMYPSQAYMYGRDGFAELRLDKFDETMWSYISRHMPYDLGAAHYLSEELEALWSDEEKENDIRYAWMTSDTTSTGVPFTTTGRRVMSGAYKTFMLSFSELQLIKAECLARIGGAANIAMVVDILEDLREHRFFADTDYGVSATTAEEALALVKTERRKELIVSGLNWFDLKRYHSYGDNVPTYTRTVNGQTYTLEPGSDKYVFPVSEYVLSFHPID